MTDVNQLSDGDVLMWMRTASDDLAKASEEVPDSEWHEACFAATVMLAMEANSRGLRLGRQALAGGRDD